MTDQTPQSNIRGNKSHKRLYLDDKLVDEGYLQFLGKRANVCVVLARYANYKTQICFPSYQTIMRKSGVKNRTTLSETLHILEFLGMISIKRSIGKKPNLYRMNDISSWKSLNGLTLETVTTVSNPHVKRSQKLPFNSLSSETLSELKKRKNGMKDFNHKGINEMRRELGDKMRINSGEK